jgi:hypothetical protein
MAEITNESIYEVLKSVQRGQSNMLDVVAEIRNELQAMQTHSLAVQTDIKNDYATMATIEVRLDRIEKSFDAVGEPAE